MKQTGLDFDKMRKVIEDLHEKGEHEKLNQIATLLDHAIEQTDKFMKKIRPSKLSKAQQEVVDKMRNGWILHNTTALTKNGERKQFISRATYKALWYKGVIEIDPGSSNCRLTEQYKNEQK